MQLTVSFDENVVQLEVYEDMELMNLMAYCSAELGVQNDDLQLLHDGRLLSEMNKTLKQYGLTQGEMLLAIRKSTLQQAQAEALRANARATETGGGGANNIGGPSLASSSTAQNAEDLLLALPEITLEKAARIRSSFLEKPQDMTSLKLTNMPLADALASGSLEEFHRVLNEQHKRRRDEHIKRTRMLMADPFDVETQKMIADEIQRQQIESNMQDAIEFMPEAFGQVHMLYIKCKVNGYPIEAFVDSGAQSTIMSKACAERCNVTRLIDERWSGIAQGVGTQKILGRIHMCQVQIENDFLASSFNVLENQPMDMLFGLDMLKRHQCVIDLKNNILRIGTTGSETRFLSESELPAHARSQH